MALQRYTTMKAIGLPFTRSSSRSPINYLLSSRISPAQRRWLQTEPTKTSSIAQDGEISGSASASAASKKTPPSTPKPASSSSASPPPSSPPSPTSIPPGDWETEPNFSVSSFENLPDEGKYFGVNQHMVVDLEFKKALNQVLWQFKAPIRYAFAYGSGVFPQSKSTGSGQTSSLTAVHQKAKDGTPKMIDFIFGVSHTQHWHSLNLKEHRDHYSALGSFGSAAVSAVQDKWGAGVYFHPYITVNGMLIKYGVVNIDTLCTDLSEWSTLYIAGRLQKPVKILRDDPRVRLANQVNLISALRTALLLLPPTFTERELYGTIANISYMGDPRMSLPTEDPSKVANIVGNNLPNFRRLYSPLIENLPNIDYNPASATKYRDWHMDPSTNLRLEQDMDPVKRGNIVRRLPKAFRAKLYFQYQKKYQIPQLEFDKMLEQSTDEDATSIKRRQGGAFERRIASEPAADLTDEVRGVIKKTIGWPSTSQSLKGLVTGGFSRTWRYMSEKNAKYQAGRANAAADAKTLKEVKQPVAPKENEKEK